MRASNRMLCKNSLFSIGSSCANDFSSMRVSEALFIFALIVLIFEDPISAVFPLAGYFDEIIACVGLACRLIPGRRWTVGFEPLLFLYVLFGLAGCVLQSVQPQAAVLGDVFLNLKFFFAIFLGYFVSRELSAAAFCFLSNLARVLTASLTTLILFNAVAHIYPGQEYRFGFQIPKLFFSHSENLAGAQLILLALGMIGGFRRTIWEGFWFLMAVLNIALTLRYKALAAAVFAIMLVCVVMRRGRRFSKWNYLLLLIVITPIAWEQIILYFGSASTARGALTLTSLEVASDYFPLGTGFGSFGSYMSRVYYSPIYYSYGLNKIYGLMNLSGADLFISDTFWPMVLGQTGVLGMFCYIGTLVVIYRKIEGLFCHNKVMYATALLLLVYLLIQSSASAAFVSPVSVSAGVIIGVAIGCGQKLPAMTLNYEDRKPNGHL